MALAAATQRYDGVAADGRAEVFTYLAEELIAGLGPALAADLLDDTVVAELDPAVERELGLPEGFRGQLARHGLFVRPG